LLKKGKNFFPTSIMLAAILCLEWRHFNYQNSTSVKVFFLWLDKIFPAIQLKTTF